MIINFFPNDCAPLEPCLPPEAFRDVPKLTALLLFVIAVATIGLFLHETLAGTTRRKHLTLQNARAAASRISVALRAVPLLEGDALRAVCKYISVNLLIILDMTLHQTREFCNDQLHDRELVEAAMSVRDEALKLREPVAKASVLLTLRVRSGKAQLMALEATDRYILDIAPALRKLHEKCSDARDRIPIFQIE
jgi:hypothetical protein